MPTVNNNRKHVQVFENVRLAPGSNTLTDDDLKKLQDSGSFKKATERGWVAMGRDKTATTSQTHPAKADGSAPEPGTKPAEAPLDYPEALQRSTSGGSHGSSSKAPPSRK
jgi:hypothetical protein